MNAEQITRHLLEDDFDLEAEIDSIPSVIPHPENLLHVANLNRLDYLEHLGFEGQDVSLETSLFDNGIAWLDAGDKYIFVYRIDWGAAGAFDRHPFSKDTDVEREFDWANFDEVAETNGITREEWLEQPLVDKIVDLHRHYGSQDVFGTSYWGGFKISTGIQDQYDEDHDDE